MMRTSALVGAIVVMLISASHAAAMGVSCRKGASQCLQVTVPFDRGGGSATVALHVQRVKAHERRSRTLVFLPGGPGQSASAGLRELLEAFGPRIRRRWNVVVFDPRGTGRSGPVLCPLLQNDPTLRFPGAAAQCARRLGANRSHYTTWNNIQDLEAVRARLGVDRIALFGVSYGTRVAMGYAAAYPQHVDRVVLDSVVAPEGPSSPQLASYTAMRRILASLCPRRCRGVTRDLVAETTRLVGLLRARPMQGDVYDARGKRRRRSIDALGLLDLLFATDLLEPAIRGGLAAAITAARREDPAALLRLATAARIVRLRQPPEFSAGAFAATTCAELRPPWDPAADPLDRRAQATARFDAISEAAFVPFDRHTALSGDYVPLCIAWPAPTPRPPAVPWRSIAAPTFILAGAQDVRAPLENVGAIAAGIPKASVLRVPSAGHSVFGRDEASGCARRAVRAFLLAGQGPRRCQGVRLPTPAGLAPTAFADLRPVSPLRGRPGRTLRAVDLTLGDVAFALHLPRGGGGLRGGSFVGGARWPRLRSVVYVRGVRVSARESSGGRRLVLRISGDAASRGTLLLAANGRVSGQLGGRRVEARLKTRARDFR